MIKWERQEVLSVRNHMHTMDSCTHHPKKEAARGQKGEAVPVFDLHQVMQ